MQIKRFEAKNMTEALRQIKRELGSDAVILSAKDLRRENRLLGISRKIGVEVTAAVDEDMQSRGALGGDPTKHAPTGAGGGTAASGTVRFAPPPKLVHTLYHRGDHSASGRHGNTPPVVAERPADAPAEVPPGRRDDAPNPAPAPGTGAHDRGHSAMGRHLANAGLAVETLKLGKDRTRRVALVGNAGVGKTTTIAKLAAHYKCRHDEAVGLISLDDRRLGAAGELQIYADSMALPCVAVGHADDLGRAAETLKNCRLVLVDCPAVDPDDTKGVNRLQARLHQLGRITTLLTVSAESREEDLSSTARRFAGLQPAGVVITKTDLTRSYTDMVNFLCRQGMPVYFFSTGARVPMDIARATIEGLTDRFLDNAGTPGGGGVERERAGSMEAVAEASTYLANKSSDIFHRPGCKWIRLINQANIVEFDSFAEALNHRFKPCRYCNPQHLSVTGILSREIAAH